MPSSTKSALLGLKNIQPMAFSAPTTREESFEQAKTARLTLIDIKAHIESIINALQENPSLFSQAARFWGTRPLWQKLSVGLGLLAILAIVGIAANLITLCVFLSITAIGGVVLLENHHTASQQNMNALKEGVKNLADLLSVIISAFDTIREHLIAEVERFSLENQKLTNELNKLVLTQEQLSITEENLARTQLELDAAISELTQVKQSMSLEITELKTVTQTLRGVSETLLRTILPDDKDRKALLERLDKFLEDGTAHFNQIADMFCKTKAELSILEKQLTLSHQRYQDLLNRHDTQLDRLQNWVTPLQQPGNSALLAVRSDSYLPEDDSVTKELRDVTLSGAWLENESVKPVTH